jgi:hypothetical protein
LEFGPAKAPSAPLGLATVPASDRTACSDVARMADGTTDARSPSDPLVGVGEPSREVRSICWARRAAAAAAERCWAAAALAAACASYPCWLRSRPSREDRCRCEFRNACRAEGSEAANAPKDWLDESTPRTERSTLWPTPTPN